jgi:hypothetical protein
LDLRGFLLGLLVVVILCVCGGAALAVAWSRPPHPQPVPGDSPGACSPQIWARVYKTNVLRVLHECVTVTGTVASLENEGIFSDPDGDYKFLLRLDPPYRGLLAPLNSIIYRGNLVVEIVCVLKTEKGAPLRDCSGYQNTVLLPKPGDRVRVTETYVFDPVFFGTWGWTEIHPVTRIERLP